MLRQQGRLATPGRPRVRPEAVKVQCPCEPRPSDGSAQGPQAQMSATATMCARGQTAKAVGRRFLVGRAGTATPQPERHIPRRVMVPGAHTTLRSRGAPRSRYFFPVGEGQKKAAREGDRRWFSPRRWRANAAVYGRGDAACARRACCIPGSHISLALVYPWLSYLCNGVPASPIFNDLLYPYSSHIFNLRYPSHLSAPATRHYSILSPCEQLRVFSATRTASDISAKTSRARRRFGVVPLRGGSGSWPMAKRAAT